MLIKFNHAEGVSNSLRWRWDYCEYDTCVIVSSFRETQKSGLCIYVPGVIFIRTCFQNRSKERSQNVTAPVPLKRRCSEECLTTHHSASLNFVASFKPRKTEKTAQSSEPHPYPSFLGTVLQTGPAVVVPLKCGPT